MSARRTLLHLAAKAGMLLGAIFVVTVLLVAMPGHHAPSVHGPAAQAQAAQQSAHTHAASHHIFMTSMPTQTPAPLERANEIVPQLRSGIEKYKDYHAALDDGFKIFLPNIPQPEYHFTSYRNGFLESLTFDPARPTSLLYKKTATGYELVGAMYTMPKRATEDQLNARVPLSVAMWHLHTNLCMPQPGRLRSADWSKFGLK